MTGLTDEACAPELLRVPPPQGRRAAPTPGTEAILAGILAAVLKTDGVPVDGHFFDDLGADSLVMAQFCARVRKHPDVPAVSMKDVYRYPTLRRLAAALRATAPAPASVPAPAPAQAPAKASAAAPRRASTAEFVLCGTLQVLIFLASALAGAAVAVIGFEWTIAATGFVPTYLRAVAFAGATLALLFVLPVAAKWALIGRWEPQEIRVWSLRYVRFWVVKSLVQRNPLALLFVGSPLYPLYLRALGAKIGPSVVILSRNVPLCTDLLTIGAGTVVRKDCFLPGYHARAGVIHTGPVTLGRGVFVGEATVLDIGTSVGDRGQLGHTSALHPGQSVPAGACWHGSPAQPAAVTYRALHATRCGPARRAGYATLQVLNLVLVSLPLAIGGMAALFAAIPALGPTLGTGPAELTHGAFYRHALAAAAVLFFGGVLAGLLVVIAVPRVLRRALRPGRVYRLYGFHYGVHRSIAYLTNLKFYAYLFGDSSRIVNYLRCLGYQLTPVQQTGSNFGQRIKHESPFLSSVGTGTVVADGLSLANAEFTSTSFRLSRVSVGRDNFVGNNIVYPAQGRTGDNCLLATKVMVPIDGAVRSNVGLLGSPCFEIPRTVARDGGFDLTCGAELAYRLAAKNRHNTVTVGLYLLVRWVFFVGFTMISATAAAFYPALGILAVAAANVAVVAFTVAYWVGIERAVIGLQALRPAGCSIYDEAFWRHERFWKVPSHTYVQLFDGTPFKPVIWRLLGVRIGRRVFDDGLALVEKTFVSIGDEATFNRASIVQTHSQEDGAFKSDRSTVGAGATLGVGAFVHYGVTIGQGAELAPDSFLMKGEEMPAGSRWGGNPARDLSGEMSGSLGVSPESVSASSSCT